MGQTKILKCHKCGNEWEHWGGIGFLAQPIKGSKKYNTTGDADKVIKCPKCNSKDFEEVEDGIVAMWD